MNQFTNAVKSTLNESFNTSVTENGGLGYKTTGTHLLDINFALTSLRLKTEKEISNKYMLAFYENPLLALKWLFYSRDAREGLGERRTFRIILATLAKEQPEIIKALIPVVAIYGRCDDLWNLLDTDLRSDVIEWIRTTWQSDAVAMKENQPITLLAKWLPSENASSRVTKKHASIIRKALGASSANYRKALSEMRQYLKVVERKMCAKQWTEINYSEVPSQANMKYNDAFLRNDEDRRRDFLSKLEKGDKSVKINAGTLFPPDLVNQYNNRRGVDATIEALWRALPNTVQDASNIIVVGDGSSSMNQVVDSKGSVTALNVANAFEIYFSERASGEFQNQYITFSTRPRWVDLSNGKNLYEKLRIAKGYDEVADTNIEAVFNLILESALNHNLSQEQLPALLIISDMEFNPMRFKGSQKDMNGMSLRYKAHGYNLPKLIYWCVTSRTDTIPMKTNESGLILLSGFSVNTVKMVLSNKLSPLNALIEQLNTERYNVIEEIVSPLLKKA